MGLATKANQNKLSINMYAGPALPLSELSPYLGPPINLIQKIPIR